MGVFMGATFVLFPCMVGDLIGLERLPTAFAILGVINGMFYFLKPTFFGKVPLTESRAQSSCRILIHLSENPTICPSNLVDLRLLSGLDKILRWCVLGVFGRQNICRTSVDLFHSLPKKSGNSRYSSSLRYSENGCSSLRDESDAANKWML